MKQDQNIITEKNKGEEAAELREEDLSKVAGGMDLTGPQKQGERNGDAKDTTEEMDGNGAYGNRTKRRD